MCQAEAKSIGTGNEGECVDADGIPLKDHPFSQKALLGNQMRILGARIASLGIVCSPFEEFQPNPCLAGEGITGAAFCQ
jgi:hypothetical protein